MLDLAVAGGGRSPVPRLTQDEMATIVGSVRAVVGRVLKVLEKTNAIKTEEQHILMTDPEKLREMGK